MNNVYSCVFWAFQWHITEYYLSCVLSGERIHQLLHTIMHKDGGVVNKLGVWDLVSVDEKAVGHQWVPVIELAELQGDAVTVLKARVEEQGGVKFQLQHVAAQLLHVLFDYNLDDLTWRRGENIFYSQQVELQPPVLIGTYSREDHKGESLPFFSLTHQDPKV